MVTWEYLIIALPQLQAPTAMPAQSAAVAALNREGDHGWEAVGMTALGDGSVAVLMKRSSRHVRGATLTIDERAGHAVGFR
jgi:hypothetical protein